jgi:hypothetical protein
MKILTRYACTTGCHFPNCTTVETIHQRVCTHINKSCAVNNEVNHKFCNTEKK